MTSNGKQTFANISCSSGYTITGGSELSCRTDGTWDKAIPECSMFFFHHDLGFSNITKIESATKFKSF